MIKNNQRFSFLMCLLMMVAGGCYAQDTQENNTSLKERAKKSHQAFKKEVLSEYNRFRREVNEEYARFMEKSWKNYGIEAPAYVGRNSVSSIGQNQSLTSLLN